MRTVVKIVALCLLAGCGTKQAEPAAQAPSEPAAEAPAAQAPAPEPEPTSMPSDDGYEASPSVKQDDGSELYGSAFAQGVPQVTLAELLEHPDDYADKTVQTSGKVSRVCQNMGCWMELQDEQGAGELRAPLAGHSYFLPQSAIGKAATVQGTVSVRPLSEAQREHLEAEGAKATKAKVSIIADGVALR